MKSLRSQVRTLAFMALRPRCYPDLFRRARYSLALRMLPAPMGRSQAVAEKWASGRAIAVEAALERLGGVYQRLEDVFPEVMADVDARHQTIPIRMPGGAGIELIYALCELLSARTAVETGVASGFSSLAMLLSLARRDGTLYSVDLGFPRDPRYTGWVVPEHLRRYWRLFHYPDYVGVKKVLAQAGRIDLCHYDSDKTYEGRAATYRVLWSGLRPGGIFISDDIGDNTAFRDFALECELEPIVVRTPGGGGSGERFVGILVKPAT